MKVVKARIRRTIELKRGELIPRALHSAIRNARRVRFDNDGYMISQFPDSSDPPPSAKIADVVSLM
jgi:hypothetical protein